MALQIAICDDDTDELKNLSTLVTQWGHARGQALKLFTFPSAEAFLFEYENSRTFDLLLLDIEMKKLSGTDLAKRLRADGNHAEIIFITSHFEFAGEGYEVDALHYLTKPVAKDKLDAALSKAADRLIAEPPFVIISSEGSTVKLYQADILYVEAFLHYLVLSTKRGEYRIKESLSSFEERLSCGFFRIHRSYLVSLKYITKITRTNIYIEGGQKLPLARGKYDALNRAFIEYM